MIPEDVPGLGRLLGQGSVVCWGSVLCYLVWAPAAAPLLQGWSSHRSLCREGEHPSPGILAQVSLPISRLAALGCSVRAHREGRVCEWGELAGATASQCLMVPQSPPDSRRSSCLQQPLTHSQRKCSCLYGSANWKSCSNFSSYLFGYITDSNF